MPLYNFGLEGYLGYVLYAAGVLAIFLSVFRRPVIGLYFLVPLLPLQTIRYRLNDLPLGESVVYIVLLAIGLGLLRQGKSPISRTPWTLILCVYITFTVLSLWAGASYLGAPLPLPGDQRFKDWLSLMTMPAIFFAVFASVSSVRETKVLVVLMCLSILQLDRSFWNSVSGRDFSSYSEELRQELSAGGSMGYAGVNGLAAFEAQAATFLLAMAAFEKRFLVRTAYLGIAVYSVLCLMYSLSRGAYAAFLAGWVFLGLVKQRTLLVLLVIFAGIWASVVPFAVVERVEMTRTEDGQLDHSSEVRIRLWQDAMQLISANPILGTGFNTYAYMARVGDYRDTHNYYLKVLVETGVIGLLLFILLLGRCFSFGWSLFRRARNPLFAGLGLGLLGWLVCAAVSNAFGDRWSYLQIQGFFWVLAGLVARGWVLDSEVAMEGSADGAESLEESTRTEDGLPVAVQVS